MQVYNLTDRSQILTFREAIFQGLAERGGLFMPTNIPKVPADFLEKSRKLPFSELALELASLWLADEIPETELSEIVTDAFNFPVVLHRLSDNLFVLELFHGPTLAFKDFAARFMARTMAYFQKDEDALLNVLVATSGDTGSAVASAFYRVPGIRVIILYPAGKISELQEQQIATFGENVMAVAVTGTFDDCQRLVKQAFQDPDLRRRLRLTSANSINIARLLPQSFYYWFAVSRLSEAQLPVGISVPSGNFGNLTGGLFAREMGLPVARFVAATNVNDVVPNYLHSGVFRPRPSVATLSNAMDVGNPSNFSRILELFDNDWKRVREQIRGAAFTDEQTVQAIGEVHRRFDYFLDPHSAVGYLGLEWLFRQERSLRTGIFLATAHPAKFRDVVEQATGVRVSLPPALVESLQKEKRSLSLSADYEELRSFLLDLPG